MTDTATASSGSHSVTEKHIPVVRRKARVMRWAAAVDLPGHAEAFDWIVTKLYQQVEAVLPDDGEVGVAAEFRARAGSEVKLRAVIPYRPGNYAFCEFLILKTANGVAISHGKGHYISWPRIFGATLGAVAFWIKGGLVLALCWNWMLVIGGRAASSSFWMGTGGALLMTCVAALIFVPLARALNQLKIDDDPALISSAQETIASVYNQFVQDLKTPGTPTLSKS